MRDHILFYYFSYGHVYISGKVNLAWQIISLHYFFIDQFQSRALLSQWRERDMADGLSDVSLIEFIPLERNYLDGKLFKLFKEII